MPQADPVRPKAKKVTVTVTRPDAGEATRTRPAPKPPKPPKRPRVTVPDAGEATRSRGPAFSSPDQQDRERTPHQQAHDRAVTAQTVKAQRVKALREKNAGSGTRALVHWVKSNLHDEVHAKTTDTHGHGAGGGHLLGVITANLPVAGFSAKVGLNALKDAGELAVTTPSSVAKLASDVAHHPKKVPGELVKPYVDFAKHPLKTAEEKPISTALMVAPAGRLPGRVAGRVARFTGHQTLERPAATLTGTALKQARIGSRDFFRRASQAKKDAANPNPEVPAKEVQKRVDEHFDQAKHEAHRIEAEHVRAARKATKGQPKPVRVAAVAAAREHAHEVAQQASQVRFAHEFGANVRLSHSVAVREALHTVRRQAVAKADQARAAAREAGRAHDAALADAKLARAKAQTSPKLAALETHRGIAMKALVDVQKTAAKAKEAHAHALGRAKVLSRTVAGRETPMPNGVWPAGGHGVQVAKAGVDAAGQAVKDARARLKDLDRQIADERARINGVPPAQAQALTNAIHAHGAAKVALAQARADAHAAAHAHIAAKQATTNSSLVNPASEGRLFDRKAEAATVVKKLNQAAHATGAKKPVTFVLHQVGQDRWAAVPKVARQRLYGSGGRGQMGHYNVGTGKATGAKLMRASRGAFTNAVLPLSPKWLAGQGVEAGIRAAVAGAGPMDWLRIGKVAKKMNARHPGSGDAMVDRLTGGHFDLTGPARDFAHGKSLAEEFEGTPLEKVTGRATRAGNAPGVRHVRQGWAQYTKAVFGTVNGAIEHHARRAMAGQAIKNLGFQDAHIAGLFDKAIEDAANKLHGTHNQVALGRALDDMYGKYQKFSPEMRSWLLHWTPFLPWYLNAGKFLFKVLPVDHPVKAALLADISSAEEQWRKDHGLDPWEPGHAPDFLLGTYPTKSGGHLNIAHYTPFGIGADPTGAIGSLLLPQVSGPVANAAFGVDWKGDPLTVGGSHGPKFNTGEKALRAAVTALEEQVPGATQAGALTGLTPKYVNKDTTVPSAGEYLKKQLPWTPIASGSSGSSGSGTPAKSGRVKVPGSVDARVKIPGVTGRVKVP